MERKFFGGLDCGCNYDHQERKIRLTQDAPDDQEAFILIGPEVLLGIVELVASENPDFAKGVSRLHWRISKKNKAA